MPKSVEQKLSLIYLLVVALAASLLVAILMLPQPDPGADLASQPFIPRQIRPQTTSLFFAGDIMLSRGPGQMIRQADNPVLPFESMLKIIQDADISFANLESPFAESGPIITEGLVFKAEPQTVDGLVAAGFDVLSTANNHSFDQGRSGIAYTRELLQTNGIEPVGTGLDCHDGVVIVRNKIKFGFLAYSYSAFNDGGTVPDPLVCDWNDTEQILEDVATLKTRADAVIVSAHMGEEYTRQPSTDNAQAARAIMDAGADLFVGHHPHWIQTIEQYDGKWIFYSLGNFVFDQMWSIDTREGLTLLIEFEDDKLSSVKLIPVVSENYCCPRMATEAETKSILQKINLTSTELLVKN